MARMGKRYKNTLALFERNKEYAPKEAIELVKKMATAKFDETVDVALNLRLKKGQTLRDTMVLPHQLSTEKKILVFARGEKAMDAEKAGATYVGDNDYIEKIKGGWLDFDVVIATPDMMKDIGRLGAVLGRRGLMPNPKTKTVTMDVVSAINELKKGRIEIRADKSGVVHIAIGKASMGVDSLIENIVAIIQEVKAKKPADAKGDFMASVVVSSTMGPGVRVAIS